VTRSHNQRTSRTISQCDHRDLLQKLRTVEERQSVLVVLVRAVKLSAFTLDPIELARHQVHHRRVIYGVARSCATMAVEASPNRHVKVVII